MRRDELRARTLNALAKTRQDSEAPFHLEPEIAADGRLKGRNAPKRKLPCPLLVALTVLACAR